MSSFQFPANPSDGDIVVRGDLQAFYNAATNTWRVSQVPTAPGIPGPPGPPGPIGPPGQGVQISGVVDTFADLPAPNAAQFEFWIVDDTNELYWSDGLTWTNFGGPIQGPQGETGEKGADGTNGQNGRGWYDTEIITENDEYKVKFLSNDGLTFTTDNLKGPQGDAGQDGQDAQVNVPLATKNSPGIVQIGDGIDVDTAGVISTDLSTVDLDTGEDPISYSLGFTPTYGLNSQTQNKFDSAYVGPLQPQTVTINIPVPAQSTGALVYYFTTSGANPFTNSGTSTIATSSEIVASLAVSGAQWTDGLNLAVSMTHNMAGKDSQNYRIGSTAPVMKVGRITYPAGTTQVTFTQTTRVTRLFRQNVTYGTCRIILDPFRQEGDIARTIENIAPYYTDEEIRDSVDFIDDPANDLTPEEVKAINADLLKIEITNQTTRINDYLSQDYPDDATLIGYRQDLHDLRMLSGTYEDVWNALDAIIANIDAYTDYQFPFE